MKTLLSILAVVAASTVHAQYCAPVVPFAAPVVSPMSVTYFSGNSATTINFGQPVYAPSMTTTYVSGNSATTINFGGRSIPTAPAVPYIAPVVPVSAPVFAPRRPVFCFD
ncbi:MAG: hypothetical protein ACKOJB_16910 [Chthoniobacterales bacterium]